MYSIIKNKLFNSEDQYLKRWRNELGEFERRVLIPGFKGRIENIISVLKRMKDVCAKEQKTPILPYVFQAMHNSLNVPLPNPQKAALNYIKTFDKVIDDDFLEDAEKILSKFKDEVTWNMFIEIMIDLKNYCNSLFAVKNKTFSYAIGFGGVFLGPAGNPVGTVQPVEATIMWHPFNLHYNELCGIAKSTIESIQSWEKDQGKLKKSYFDYLAHRTQLRGFKWSVVVAALFGVITAWFFFVSSDYLKVRKYELELENNSNFTNSLQGKLEKATASTKVCQENLVVCQMTQKK